MRNFPITMATNKDTKKEVKEAIENFVRDLKHRGLITLEEKEYLLRWRENK